MGQHFAQSSGEPCQLRHLWAQRCSRYVKILVPVEAVRCWPPPGDAKHALITELSASETQRKPIPLNIYVHDFLPLSAFEIGARGGEWILLPKQASAFGKGHKKSSALFQRCNPDTCTSARASEAGDSQLAHICLAYTDIRLVRPGYRSFIGKTGCCKFRIPSVATKAPAITLEACTL